MGTLKPLIIGELVANHPVIQGGMGVGISLSSLAGAVAKAGGIGIISTAQIGFREPDFKENPLEANLRAIGQEMKKAREIAPEGIIGFNIMVATKSYASYVKKSGKSRSGSYHIRSRASCEPAGICGRGSGRGRSRVKNQDSSHCING